MKRLGNKFLIAGIIAIVAPFFGASFRSLANETYSVCFGVGLIFVILGLIIIFILKDK